MKERPSLAFLCPENPFNKKTASGTPYYMIKALQKYWGEVQVYYFVKNRLQYKILRIIPHIAKIFLKKDFDYMKSIFFSKLLGKYFSKKLLEKEYDILFCNGSFPIAYLETDIPIIIFSDSSFGLLLDYYPNRSHYFKKLLQSGRIIEQRGYDKASLILFASQWAANYALSNYACQGKVEVLPLGANIESIPDVSVIDYRLKNRDVCNLLFLGVDWERKGGNIVIETFKALKQRGMKVQLTISGCKPNTSCDGITILPFINKNSDTGLRQFDELFKKSHFMFVPTRAECFGMVFCEASAYGMPVISTDTGGVPGAVENGINGYLLPISATGNDYADVIQGCFFDETKYKALCKSSRKWFDHKLDHKTIITSMMQLYLKSGS